MAEVTFYRSSGWAWGGRKFRVEVDGNGVGKLARKDRLAVEVAAGSHRLVARVGKFQSQAMTVTLGPVDTLKVAVRPIAPDKSTPALKRQALLLVQTDDFDDQGPKITQAYKKQKKAK
ncbi:MAG: hypothetical protein JWM76_2457 [Pseudonocardiales bacterium]|nr:hypothetical protein [Pseudonocardiales bacterium]